MSERQGYDCVVAGSCVVDLLCQPVALTKPIGAGVLHEVGAMGMTAGGITSNAGICLARLGMKVGVLSYVGDDEWGVVLRRLLVEGGVDDAMLAAHPTAPTSTTVVVIDESGERSFLHCVGAPKLIDAAVLRSQMDVLRRTRYLLLGYYSLLPNLEGELGEVLAEIRRGGCKTALDAAGNGGTMQPLEGILPELDVYVPSLAEARHQTGLEDPRAIIERYRGCGGRGLLGVKLGGRNGVLLSPAEGEFVQIESCEPPGAVVDTTGAGDCFYAGLLAGLMRGMSLEEAGRVGAASAACCVTAIGGSAGCRGWEFTCGVAGLGGPGKSR